MCPPLVSYFFYLGRMISAPTNLPVIRRGGHWPSVYIGRTQFAPTVCIIKTDVILSVKRRILIYFKILRFTQDDILKFINNALDNIEYRYYNGVANVDIRYKGGGYMPRLKFQTLTEQMFYILLCLKEECCGIDIMDKVSQMTDGRVKVGSGTLYNLLEQFLESDMIRETKSEGRRRSYVLTQKGREILDSEYNRLCTQAEDYKKMFLSGERVFESTPPVLGSLCPAL